MTMLSDINSCSQKHSCGSPESVKNSLLPAANDKRDIDKALAAAKGAGYFDKYRALLVEVSS